MPDLDVWLLGRLAGRLSIANGKLSYAYDHVYARDGGPPLSHALPVRDEPYGDADAHSFFGNLLPEGDARVAAARWVGVSERSDFALLDALGGDCAGAVSLLPPGTRPDATTGGIDWLDGPALASELDGLPRRPLHADPDGDVRISLAGAQDKLVVVVDGERIGVPTGSTPSTHIIKTPIRGYDDTVSNEAYCLALARRVGLEAAHAEVRSVEGREFLLVERYDRRRDDGDLTRIHQEDFCQALGLPASAKYEVDGGPRLIDCFSLLRDAVDVPATDILRLLDVVTFNFLVGNHDAHGKNFSLLHERDGTRLAPFYDLLSTTVYGLGRKMAMKIGGEYRADRVERRHWDRLLEDAGLGAPQARRRIGALVTATAGAAGPLATELDDLRGATSSTVDDVVATVTARSQQLVSALA
jgi:serine/threonine-protein kinase HipA